MMSNPYAPQNSDVHSVDHAKPRPPQLGMWLLSIMWALSVSWALTRTGPGVLAQVAFVFFMGIGMYQVGRWAIAWLRYLIQRNRGAHFDGLR